MPENKNLSAKYAEAAEKAGLTENDFQYSIDPITKYWWASLKSKGFVIYGIGSPEDGSEGPIGEAESKRIALGKAMAMAGKAMSDEETKCKIIIDVASNRSEK